MYVGAVLLLITGRIGISVLCNFSWVLRVGGKVVLRVLSVFVNYQVTFLHCFVYQIVEFSVGSLVNNLNILTKDPTEKFHNLIHKTM